MKAKSTFLTDFTRRQFLQRSARMFALGAACLLGRRGFSSEQRGTEDSSQPFFRTRGVVLVPEDLTLRDWPERAQRAGLTTIGLHHGVAPRIVADFIRSENGQKFLARCRQLNLQIEYELHAVQELLPRSLFAKNPQLFRMNEKGDRTPDANLCVHSTEALAIASEQAIALAKVLRPTTHRYFYWSDDAKSWCLCPKCRDFSESDQALILENHLVTALRTFDPKAQLAHLAYSNTLWPPTQIKPKRGIFLEYAPINRRYDIPYRNQRRPEAKDTLMALEANLRVFGTDTAQVLEYWLDVSRFSKWKRPSVKLPWNETVFASDLDTYGKLGIRHVTSFAVFIDADYVKRHGEPAELGPYGKRLANWRPQ
ncbi:MAG: DUF4838 domain-containing protein [Verrucomicrobia bacterium]|nr:DUF4838 domain-containing protein [Verrucomicrobiota bacterium]